MKWNLRKSKCAGVMGMRRLWCESMREWSNAIKRLTRWLTSLRHTKFAISCSLSLPILWSSSVPSASRPRRIGVSNRFLNSWAVPSRPGFTNWTCDQKGDGNGDGEDQDDGDGNDQDDGDGNVKDGRDGSVKDDCDDNDENDCDDNDEDDGDGKTTVMAMTKTTMMAMTKTMMLAMTIAMTLTFWSQNFPMVIFILITDQNRYSGFDPLSRLEFHGYFDPTNTNPFQQWYWSPTTATHQRIILEQIVLDRRPREQDSHFGVHCV